jgi:hypothetical protein
VPEQKIPYFAAVDNGPGDVLVDKYELQEFTPDRDRISDSFRNISDTTPQFLFYCYERLFSLCQSDVYLQRDQLSFRPLPHESHPGWDGVLPHFLLPGKT